MKFDLTTLNDEQLLPLKQTEGAILVTAGAGSGKTRLLTHRVAYLIEEKQVSPYNILAITFTNKAAGEMKSRIEAMVDKADGVWIATFHSTCAKILRRDIQHIKPYTKTFTIYSEDDSEKVVKEVLSSHGSSDDKLKKAVMFHLSNWKNTTQSLDEYVSTHADEEDMRKIGIYLAEYQQRLQDCNALDFDDLLRLTYQLFTLYPEVLEYYANRFEYILVDEFQDTNILQYKLVKLLACVHGNVFAVGDEDQCIYSWRGANFQNIFNFKNDYPDVKVYKLERNYRSSPKILSVANNVIKNNKTRLDKKMWTDKVGGDEPVLYNAYDERDEALFVAKQIEKLVARGVGYDQIAVLMRLNALSRSFEEAFLSYNIPHRIYGGYKFYERAEIRNIISYLRIFVNPKDDISFLRIINFPKRSIGDGAISKIKALCGEKSLLETVLSPLMLDENAIYKKLQKFVAVYNDIYSQLDSLSLSQIAGKIVKDFEICSAYQGKTEEDTDRLLNIDSFIASVKEYENANPDKTLADYLETITLISDSDEIGQNGAVTIATVHAVKGLEFKAVFVVGLEEGIFPISRASSSNDLEEERRLLYVAITRAEEELYLSHCSKRYLYGQSQYQASSRFIRELGLLSFANVGAPKNDFVGKRQETQASAGFNFVASDFVKKEDKSRKDYTVYKVGQRVEHPRYGEGQIMSISDDGLVGEIYFDDFGNKSLMLDLAPLQIIE